MTKRLSATETNYFRVEAETSSTLLQKLLKAGYGKRSGILIGDGSTLWLYWPDGRFKYRFEDAKEYEKTRMTSYMTKPARAAGTPSATKCAISAA